MKNTTTRVMPFGAAALPLLMASVADAQTTSGNTSTGTYSTTTGTTTPGTPQTGTMATTTTTTPGAPSTGAGDPGLILLAGIAAVIAIGIIAYVLGRRRSSA